jgi:6-phosphogluconolactonase/glucosamine-6-phosphate isomerase/deaminase
MLLVSGEHKAKILAEVLDRPISIRAPATYPREMRGVVVIADRAAAGLWRRHGES